MFRNNNKAELYCHACKAHIATATFVVTALVEIPTALGYPTGKFRAECRSFCARCEPDHDYAVAYNEYYDDLRLNSRNRTLVDAVSRERAADRQNAAIAQAVQAALEAAATERGETPEPTLYVPDDTPNDPMPQVLAPKGVSLVGRDSPIP